MATNNLLVNNEYRVLREEQQKVERSAHNLSQSRKFPCDVGYIYPFFCRKTLPSDSFKIWTNVLIKQLQPLLVPQMVSFTVNTAFFWVDYNLAFPDFEYFLINQKGAQNIELPYLHLPSYGYLSSAPLLPSIANDYASASQQGVSIYPLSENVRTFLDITQNACDEKVEALPFWAYQTVCRDFFTNIDRLSDSEYKDWFPSDSNKWKLKAGENFVIGDGTVTLGSPNYSITGSYVNFDKLRVHNVRGDYFVNSYPTPLRGDVPTLTATGESDSSVLAQLLNNFVLDEMNSYPILDKDLIFVNEGNYSQVDIATQGTGYSILGAEDPNDRSNNNNLRTSGLNSNNFFYNLNRQLGAIKSSLSGNLGQYTINFQTPLSVSLSITTRQLRLLESLTRKREIDILMKPRLKNYLQTYFGVNRYKDDSLYQPVFIGSTTQQILINDIAQTTATSDSPLGRQGATAMSLGSGYVGEYYCRNYGCLLGVMYILPDFDYEPALPKEWTELVPDEFVNPEFSHLSMSPILNKELYVSADSDWNNQVLGYMGMYDNYRTSQNLVCGDFLNSSFSDIQQFAQVRRFDNNNKPEITTTFLNSHQAFDKSVFSVPTLPPFIAQCVSRVEAVRPLPQLAIPRG